MPDQVRHDKSRPRYNRWLMSLITRCPACGTMFKVVADQLKISEGWVRCGHCAEVFDATADLRDESATELPAAPMAREPTAPAPPVEAAPFSEFESSLHSEVGDSVLDGTPDPREIDE